MSSLIRFSRLGKVILNNSYVKPCLYKRNMGEVNNLQYREQMRDIPKWKWLYAQGIGFVTIFWMGYMTYNHYDHITGEFYIHPEQWTDEELGIPPDEEDIYPEGYVPLNQRS